MKRKLFQRAVCLILSVTTLLGALGITSFAAEGKVAPQTNAGSAATLEDMVALLGTSTYAEYTLNHSDSKWQNKQLSEKVIDVVANLAIGSDAMITSDSADCLDSEEANKSAWEAFGDNWDNTVYLPTTNAEGTKAGSATWHFPLRLSA